MNENPTSPDWGTTRGRRWAAHLPALEATLEPVDAPLMDALELDAPLRIADVGCGGGGTALAVLRRAPGGSLIHGYDISPPLIELAQRRAPEQSSVRFEVADVATALPRERYDRLVSRFGVMFFEPAQEAFSNLARWLEPRGRFAFAVWGSPSENPWMTSVRQVVARVVELPRPDPHAPGPFRYEDSDVLLALLARCGFAELQVRDWRGALAIGGALGAAEAARFALSAQSGFADVLADAGSGAFDEAHRALTTSFAEHEHEGIVRLNACVHIVSGARA